jgi:GT2 family glycosyltransferase
MSSTKPTVSIIVVNFRTRDLTMECLRSIVRETHEASYEILVIDNASGDGLLDQVRQEMPTARCMQLATNVGFARANNIAAAKARGSYLLLLNPDTLVLDGAIDKLLAFAMQKPDAKVWGGQSLRGDRSLDPTSCWRRITLWSAICRTLSVDTAFPNSAVFSSEAYGGWDRASVREVDIICGCFMLIDRMLWKQLNGFDGTFFMYGEEADFCMRAAKVGARPTFTPDAEIIHYGGASEQVHTEKLIRGLSARAEIIKRHFSPTTKRAGLFVNLLQPLVRAWGYRLVGLASRSPTRRHKAEVWLEVWKRRSTWRYGFGADLAATAPQIAA